MSTGSITQVCRLTIACQKFQSACAHLNNSKQKTHIYIKIHVIAITAHKNALWYFSNKFGGSSMNASLQMPIVLQSDHSIKYNHRARCIELPPKFNSSVPVMLFYCKQLHPNYILNDFQVSLEMYRVLYIMPRFFLSICRWYWDTVGAKVKEFFVLLCPGSIN